MHNKRGWIRILEATIAVLLVSSVLVFVNTKHVDRRTDPADYVYLLQKEILNEVTLNESLRSAVLNSTTEILDPKLPLFLGTKVPVSFNARLVVCGLANPPLPCKLNATDFIAAQGKDIFVEERIISSNVSLYTPKKVRLFVWEN